MRIDRLELENFRCFSRYEIALAPRFTLLIGDNGSGKTAMLDALAVAAGSFFLGARTDGVEARNIHPTWLRVIVGALMRAFPRVQFVGTTHSPFIIQDLHGVAGTVLWDLNSGGPLPVETKSIEDIAEDKQGVEIPQQSRRFLDMMKVAEQYYALLREPDGHDPARREELKNELDRLSLP